MHTQMAQKHTEFITQLIYRILRARGSHTIGTGQLSSLDGISVAIAADQGTRGWGSRPIDAADGRGEDLLLTQLHATGGQSTAVHHSGGFVYTVAFLLLLISPLCPLKRNASSHQAGPRDDAVIKDTYGLV